VGVSLIKLLRGLSKHLAPRSPLPRKCSGFLYNFTIYVIRPDATGNAKVKERIPIEFSNLITLYTKLSHQVFLIGISVKE
jgi:hypothetical protein